MDIQALLPAAQLGKSWSSSIRRNTQVSKINLWEIFKPEFVISSNYSPGWSHFQHSSYIYQPHRFFICIFFFLIYVTWNALLLQREELQLRARSRDRGAETSHVDRDLLQFSTTCYKRFYTWACSMNSWIQTAGYNTKHNLVYLVRSLE